MNDADKTAADEEGRKAARRGIEMIDATLPDGKQRRAAAKIFGRLHDLILDIQLHACLDGVDPRASWNMLSTAVAATLSTMQDADAFLDTATRLQQQEGIR